MKSSQELNTYFNKHSEFKYLLDLINQIDWSVIPEFDNPRIGRTGYSRHSLLKALFVQKVKGLNFLADAAYDSSDLYDFVHLESESTAFIPLRTSSKKSNLYLIASAFLAHSMGRNDLLAPPKTLMHETAVC